MTAAALIQLLAMGVAVRKKEREREREREKEGRKEGGKEGGRKEERKERRKEGKKKGRDKISSIEGVSFLCLFSQKSLECRKIGKIKVLKM